MKRIVIIGMAAMIVGCYMVLTSSLMPASVETSAWIGLAGVVMTIRTLDR